MMRLFLFLFAVSIVFQNCKSIPVKETFFYNGKKYELEKPSDRLKIVNLLNNLINSSTDLKANLEEFKILKSIDEATKEEYTYLLCTDTKNFQKLAVVLVYNGTTKVYEVQEKMFVVCFDSADCAPFLYNNNWACETENIDNFDCKKSVIVLE